MSVSGKPWMKPAQAVTQQEPNRTLMLPFVASRRGICSNTNFLVCCRALLGSYRAAVLCAVWAHPQLVAVVERCDGSP